MRWAGLVWLAAWLAAVGCGRGDGSDGGPDDVGPLADAGAADGGADAPDAGPPDAGPGDAGASDGGPPPDLDALVARYFEAAQQRSAARCPCEYPSFDTALCARRYGFGPEVARCELEAGLDAGWTLAEAACRVAAAEEEAACAEAATRCEAVDACPYDDSGCGAAADIPDDAFFDAYDACVERELVGPALGCRPEPAPDASSATGAGVFAGTTAGAGDDSTPSCGEGVDYADVAHEWVAPADGTYRFDTDGSAGEFVLEVRSDCDGPALGCDYWDGSSGARNRAAVVDVDVRAGDRLVVIVDTPFDSTAGPYVVNVGDWGAVERCRWAADAMAATCRGDGARTCQAGAYADACAEGARPDLLADAIDCLEAESDLGSCRTFSDPSGARDCVRDVYAGVSDARVDAIVADLGARCGRTYEGWDTASPLLSRTAADLLAIEDCVAAATTCREANECTAVPSILACHE